MKVEDQLQELVLYDLEKDRGPLGVLIDRGVQHLKVGRECIGSKIKLVGGEPKDVKIYRKTRYVVVFSDGLELNVSSAIYSYPRKQGHKTVYFNRWG
jgi:hypothetical protein